jgi:Big-like domain-containing protein
VLARLESIPRDEELWETLMRETNTRAVVIFVGLGLLLLLQLLLVTTPARAGILDASWTAPTTNTDGSPLQDLASYRVYYGTPSAPCPGSSRAQMASATSSPGTNQAVSLRLTGLTVGTLYNVAVTAVDTAGNESACSSVASAVARTEIAVTPTGTVNFGSVNIGSFVERTFTVSNTAGGTVSGTATVAAPFTITSGSPFSLSGVGASRVVTVRFTPTTAITVSSSLSFTAGGGTIAPIVTGSGASGADITPPTVTITSPTSGTTLAVTGSSLTLQGTASDNVGVTAVTWANSGGGSGTATGTSLWAANAIALQTGTNLITVTARDAAGNKATASLTVTRSSTSPPAGGGTIPGGSQTTTVDFDNPTPPGASSSVLSGMFGGIDWGSGQWRWESAYGVDPTRHVFFANETGKSRTLKFSPTPRRLVSLRVFAGLPGTLTLTDDAGQSKTQAIPANQLVTVTTAWTKSSTTVTVAFTAGWELGVTTVTYDVPTSQTP